jgi:hypothetical protein
MEPLNKDERTQGTLKFLALFIAGIIIILIPFYFLVRLPEKAQQVNSDQISSLQGQLDFQRDFTIRMDSVMKLMDQYSTPDIDIDKLNADIGLILSEMDKSVGNSENGSFNLYKSTIRALVELKKSKQSNLKYSAELDKARKDLDECQEELAKIKEKPSDSLDH